MALDDFRAVAFRSATQDPSTAEGAGSVADRDPFLNCPHCGEPVAHPGLCRGARTAMAECERCDVLFDPADYTTPGS